MDVVDVELLKHHCLSRIVFKLLACPCYWFLHCFAYKTQHCYLINTSSSHFIFSFFFQQLHHLHCTGCPWNNIKIHIETNMSNIFKGSNWSFIFSWEIAVLCPWPSCVTVLKHASTWWLLPGLSCNLIYVSTHGVAMSPSTWRSYQRWHRIIHYVW